MLKDGFLAAVARARAALIADAGRLWGVDLSSARWIGSTDDSWLATEDPGLPDFAYDGSLWVGPRPADGTKADTAIDWAGRRWAIVALPMRGDPVRTLIHECWHAHGEPSLFPGVGAEMAIGGGDLLDRADGRLWLRLECAALARGSLVDAAAFRRRRRDVASAAEWRRECGLELVEGLAEYTAWRLSGADSAMVGEYVGALPLDGSLVRSFMYRTVPAYGFLLDDAVPDWRRNVVIARDLGAVLPSSRRAEEIAESYGFGHIHAEERARDKDREIALAETRRRFAGPLLRIRPGSLSIDFNPQRVRLLDEGTVYEGLGWRIADGAALRVEGEALVTVDWREIHVPLDTGDSDAMPRSGGGWSLTLPVDWRINRDERGWLVEPPASF